MIITREDHVFGHPGLSESYEGRRGSLAFGVLNDLDTAVLLQKVAWSPHDRDFSIFEVCEGITFFLEIPNIALDGPNSVGGSILPLESQNVNFDLWKC